MSTRQVWHAGAMRQHNRARPIVAVALTLALAFTSGCSSDKKDDAAESTTTAKVSADDKDFCEAARAAQNLPASERVAGAEKQAAVAPKELATEHERVIEYLKFAEANPDQQAEVAAKLTAVAPDLSKIVAYTTEHCGLGFDFGG